MPKSSIIQIFSSLSSIGSLEKTSALKFSKLVPPLILKILFVKFFSLGVVSVSLQWAIIRFGAYFTSIIFPFDELSLLIIS